MKNLHIKDSLKNFLFNLENFITIYENHLHVYNYQKLKKITDEEIILIFDKFMLIIKGINLKLKKMTKQELLINGTILKVEFNYEK